MDLDLHLFTMCPRMILYLREYYRIITSALFHGNLMHIGMNMLSTFHLSAVLEKRLGTIHHLISTLWAILLTSLFYVLVACLASFVIGYDAWMYEHAVGFSGVLFHFCVLECNMMSNQSRNLFGMVNVPAYLYPWALLIVLQMFMPNLSLLGHISGIATGSMKYYGLLQFTSVGAETDSWTVFSWLARYPAFAPAPSGGGEVRLFQEPLALVHSLRQFIRSMFKLLSNVLETVSVCLFGRGHRLNSNSRLPWWSTSTTNTTGGHVLGSARPLEEDEDWIGLPTVSNFEREPLTVTTSQLV